MKTTSIPLPYEQDFALRDLLDVGLQNFCPEIEEASSIVMRGRGREGVSFLYCMPRVSLTTCKTTVDQDCRIDPSMVVDNIVQCDFPVSYRYYGDVFLAHADPCQGATFPLQQKQSVA